MLILLSADKKIWGKAEHNRGQRTGPEGRGSENCGEEGRRARWYCDGSCKGHAVLAGQGAGAAQLWAILSTQAAAIEHLCSTELVT